jgi:hypothetical protein
MFNTLPPVILLDIAIFFTALSWGLGAYLVDKKAHVFASLTIGCFVCLVGYSVESLGVPPWAVVAAPIPLDFLLLWYVLRKLRKMRRLRRNLGNLHRVPCPVKQISSLRLLDSSLETAPINCARNLNMRNEVPHD